MKSTFQNFVEFKFLPISESMFNEMRLVLWEGTDIEDPPNFQPIIKRDIRFRRKKSVE